jgi:FAD/FMN-containing dehydrogenase
MTVASTTKPPSPVARAEHRQAPRPPLAPDLIARFAAIVGTRYAITNPADLAPYVTESRGLYRGHTQLALQPGSVAEVAAILALANETGTAIVPQGGNTGLVGGQIAIDGEVVLTLRRLDRIREIDALSNAMTCEAGVVLAKAQAANAGGTGALAYGVARDLVLGLEVVLADGRVLHGLNKLKKDNTGYDLKNLFIGAEGTLGVITAATLKLFPAPKTVEAALVGVPSPHAAVELLNLVQERSNRAATSFELFCRMAVDFALRHGAGCRDPLAAPHPWYVLVQLSSAAQQDLRSVLEDALHTGMARGLVGDAAIAESLEHRRAFWHLRDVLPEAQKPEGGSIKHDISVPVAAVPDFLREADAVVAALVPGCRPVPFGHLGDGNIHYNITQPVGADTAAYLARWDEMNTVVHAVVTKLGGSISAEHGIGLLKRKLLPDVKDPVALDLMRSLKRMLDPNNILNPGKVL